jgi:trimethylamine:corrinoid methyltransferase-like protein
LTSPLTLRWLREEIGFPSAVIDRRSRGQWEKSGGKDAAREARKRVEQLLAHHRPRPLTVEVQEHLSDIMSREARRHGMEQLPLVSS